jgi:hypothetical protein
MGDWLNVPYLSYDQIRDEADRFLKRYHQSSDIPVPIEEIIDLQLKIDIIPIPGLKRFEIDAYITSDMTAICVDEGVYSNVPNRYRFTLAHELAHAILHQKVFRACSFHDITSWKQTQARIPEKEYGWLEWQAYAFAGLILVPPSALSERMVIARDQAKSQSIDIASISDEARRLVAGWLARQFEVSTDVIERRIDKDGLWF